MTKHETFKKSCAVVRLFWIEPLVPIAPAQYFHCHLEATYIFHYLYPFSIFSFMDLECLRLHQLWTRCLDATTIPCVHLNFPALTIGIGP